MNQVFDYRPYFDIALNQIRMIRDPHATQRELIGLGWYSVLQQQVINIGGHDYEKHVDTIEGAREATKICIYNILIRLIKDRAPYCSVLIMSSDQHEAARKPFVFKDTRSNTLIVVKDIGEGITWVTDDYVPDDINVLMHKTNSSSYKQVYLLHDYAYLQFVGHNDNCDDPGRGCNAYSFPWLFDTYFGNGEYKYFKAALDVYLKDVEDYLGYTVMRSLTPTVLVNFRRIVQHSIETFNYNQIINKTIINKFGKKAWIKDLAECDKIEGQFFSQNIYSLLLDGTDFSESLITAEWLLDSMSKAHAIDLTVIGTGYFKAAEQLIFRLVRLYSPNFDIKSNLGDYATYYKDNRERILRRDLHWSTRKYVYEAIFEYADLRNGYFHKDNIHDRNRILDIRNATYIIMYLLLGCHYFTSNDYQVLGLDTQKKQNDFSKLQEYITFHLGGNFCILSDNDCEQWLVADTPFRPNLNQYINTQCICFRDLIAKTPVIITENNLPKRMWSGRLDIIPDKTVKLGGMVKETLVFDNGLFVGPSIVEEDGFTY